MPTILRFSISKKKLHDLVLVLIALVLYIYPKNKLETFLVSIEMSDIIWTPFLIEKKSRKTKNSLSLQMMSNRMNGRDILLVFDDNLYKQVDGAPTGGCV